MKRVIIYGVSQTHCKTRRYIEKFLDDEYTILGYSDGHYPNDMLDHKPFFKPEDICKQQVDFVLINAKTAQAQREIQRILTAAGVPSEKIVRPSLLFEPDKVGPVDLIKSIKEQYNQETGLIFGLSYSAQGILEEKLNIPFYNCSWTSLDLYYNFHIYDYMQAYGLFTDIHTALWVFPYYYFDYDVSMTSNVSTLFTLWQLNDWHHSTDSPITNEYIKAFRMFAKKWTEFFQVQKCRTGSPRVHSGPDGTALLDPIWFSDHEATVLENKNIFVKFFNALREKGVNTALIIPPFYLNGLNEISKAAFQAKKEKFYQILRELEPETGKIPVFDYADKLMGKRNNFYDLEHLNFTGAEEFTDIINNEVIKALPQLFS